MKKQKIKNVLETILVNKFKLKLINQAHLIANITKMKIQLYNILKKHKFLFSIIKI
ncbi:hypothetical protein BpHYR1_052804 [Brachionus plicatilis]|uniref:Uncharacterized protein n=1 Tax=Brachionus plicatilis TaxID=10195 RepID=A0A3M7PHP4_BRAPC|nr:hypothetical protein BpHYR1_052804 [Brachionus plicatilis]